MEIKPNSVEDTSVVNKAETPLSRNNFVLMAVSGLLIVAGLALMTGSSSTTAQYDPDIFSVRRIVVGPMLSFLGYVLMAVSIIVKPKAK